MINLADLEGALAQYDEWNEQYEYWLGKLNADCGGDEIMRGLDDETMKSKTFLAENNFEEATAVVIQMYDKFELTGEQMDELASLRVYIRWLQQLDENGETIYKLPESEIEYLVNYVETRSGRGKVFANNILCELYGICIENYELRITNYEMEGEQDEILRFAQNDGESENSYALTALRSYGLQDITLIPNPTTGELRITNYELRNGVLSAVEVYDIYGRKLQSNHFITSSSHHLINISHLPSGIYFVKIKTEAGEVVKKVIKN
jgi:hypothetical protein